MEELRISVSLALRTACFRIPVHIYIRLLDLTLLISRRMYTSPTSFAPTLPSPEFWDHDQAAFVELKVMTNENSGRELALSETIVTGKGK